MNDLSQEQLIEIGLPYWKHNRKSLRFMCRKLQIDLDYLVYNARDGKNSVFNIDNCMKEIKLLIKQAKLVTEEERKRLNHI